MRYARNRICTVTLLHTLIAAPITTMAETSLEALYFDDLPVILTATRLEQPIKDAPASITVIDQEMIKASGVTEMVDLLRLVPGFVVGYYSGSKFSASYHAMTDQFARDMQVLIDGRSIYDPMFGGVSWSDLPLHVNDILRIEVIRGPNAAAYGSNSFAGIINIVTIHPSRLPDYTAHTLVGSGDTRNVTLRHAGGAERFDYALSVNYDENSGFDSRASDSSKTRWANLRGNYQIDAQQNLEFAIGYSNGNREDGFVGDDVQPARNTQHKYHYQNLKWVSRSSVDNEVSIQAYHNYQVVDDHFQLDTPVPPMLYPVQMGYGFGSERFDIELQNKSRLNKDWRLVWGVGARRDKGRGIWTVYTDDYITRNQARAYFNVERKSDSFTYNLGAMYERFEDKKPLFSPRLAVNYHHNKQHTFRASFSQAYRMPTLYEDNADVMIFAGDPAFDFLRFKYTSDDLEPEKINAYEIGYIGTFARQGLTIDGKLFLEKLTDRISESKNDNIPDPIPAPEIKVGADEFINDRDATISGFEMGLKWKPTQDFFLHAGFNLARIEGERRSRLDDQGVAHYLPLFRLTPKKVYSLLGSYAFDNGFRLSSAYYYLDYISWRGDGDNIPNSGRWDITLSKDFRTAGAGGNISLMLQNIDGDHYDFYHDAKGRNDDRHNRWSDRIFLQFELNLD